MTSRKRNQRWGESLALLDNYFKGVTYRSGGAHVFALSTPSVAVNAPFFSYYSYNVINQYYDATVAYTYTQPASVTLF